MKQPAWRFVVDADIARAAGPEPKDENKPWGTASKDAFSVLEALRDRIGYRFVFDETLLEEWMNHQGRTALRWFADMVAAGRIVNLGREVDRRWINDLIDEQLPKDRGKAAMKDAHLVALAYDHADRRVLSNDRRARRAFAALDDARVAAVLWVEASAAGCKWLLEGAPERKRWRLG